MMDDDAPTGTDNVITEFENYEQFLDSQITALDLFYLEVRPRKTISSAGPWYWALAML